MILKRFCYHIATILFMLSFLSCTAIVQAAQEIQVCAKYLDQSPNTELYYLSKGYKVKGMLLTGSEYGYSQNQNTKFFLINWDDGDFTLFKLPSLGIVSYLNSPFKSTFEDFRDQHGRKWLIKEGWNNCY